MKDIIKKLALVGIIVLLVIFLLNRTSASEKVALNFIKIYYSQYEKSEEIRKLATLTSDGKINVDLFNDFINDNFGELITDEGLDELLANRYIPNLKVVKSNIKKVEVVDFIINNSSKTEKGIQYIFEVDIKVTKRDNSIEQKNKKGWIILEDINGEWKINGFRLYN